MSFSFASSLFGRSIRDRVVRLYAWCRYVDDQIDDAASSLEDRAHTLNVLARQSLDPLLSVALPPAIKAFRELRAEVDIPAEHPTDLLKGMSMDLCQQRYLTLDELEVYCYHVAGVVGVMMSHIMGITDRQAYRHAADLGLAMQLTNICRDIIDDAKMGRLYLPEKWMPSVGLEPTAAAILGLDDRSAILPIVQLLLARAEVLYRSGDRGLKYLPFRCALAVGIAREVYSAIGREVLRRREHAWDTRTWIPLPRKIALGFKGVGKALCTLPFRIFKRPRSPHVSKTNLA